MIVDKEIYQAQISYFHMNMKFYMNFIKIYMYCIMYYMKNIPQYIEKHICKERFDDSLNKLNYRKSFSILFQSMLIPYRI